LPAKYDYIMATYSQFNSPKKKFVKPEFLLEKANGNILIMDEAHNASGSSNTGEFLQKVIRQTKGVTFLSATFAKRPDNMPIYAMKTAMSDANMNNEKLVDAIISGGVALQEVLSSQLVSEGQMIRRERSFDGVEVNYITLTEKEAEHKAVADNITEIIRDIISFQDTQITPLVENLDEIVSAEYSEAEERRGTHHAGVDMPPMFSKVFNLINQMLFAIKAESVAERAIERLKQGKKPIIAFASTMGAFLEQMDNEKGEPVSSGDKINADFKEVLMRALRGVMRYTVTTPNEETDPDDYENVRNKPKAAYKKEYKYFDASELSLDGQLKYHEITRKITDASTGLSISPIDIVISKIEVAGYSVAEVTGRKLEVKPVKGKPGKGLVMVRKKVNVNDAFRQYNNNEVDLLLINQSGATGASAHAIVTNKVPPDQVKQRVMIILQAELDINKEVQKRGRINRTGQIFKPIYDYVNSAIPAEQRLMMMLKKKLKSLDANTTSNQKQTSNMLETEDFLNKYGDKVVTAYLLEDENLWKKLGDPLKFESDNKPNAEGKANIIEGAAHKVSGRVAILPVAEQEKFYKDVFRRYNEYVEYLKQTDSYDLEVETMNLEAKTLKKEVCVAGKGGQSSFGNDSFLEKCMINNLRKPFTKDELENLIKKSLGDKDAETLHNELITEHLDYSKNTSNNEFEKINEKYKLLIEKITSEKKYQKLKTEPEKQKFYNKRIEVLNKAKEDTIDNEKRVASNRYRHLKNIFDFFYIGQGYNWPHESFIKGENSVKCVFVGYSIDKNRTNPYAPSAVQLRFAVANSVKYITLATSGEQGEKIQQIIGLSYRLPTHERNSIVDNWEKHTKEFSSNKIVRYIVTGNILQAFADYKGKLVSYTKSDGAVEKGILMPESWSLETKKGGDTVVIPIAKAKRIIASLTQGHSIYDSEKKIGITKAFYQYIFSIPKSKNYKAIYTDPEVIDLTQNKRDGFDMVSGFMRAYVDDNKMGELVDVLQNKYNLNVVVSKTIYNQLVEKQEQRELEKPEQIIKAEKLYEEDKKKYKEILKKQTAGKKDNIEKEAEARLKRIRIAKVKAAAKLKLLKLIDV